MSEAVEIVDDVAANGADHVHLSDLFKYISHYRRRGHQIGRKVGDMLEVLTLAALYRDPSLRAHLVLEPKLVGFSGAGHKVEFGLFNLDGLGKPLKQMSQLFGFVECKKVGVEQTVNQTYKKKFGPTQNLIPFGVSLPVNLSPRWADASRYEIIFATRSGVAEVEIKRNGDVVHASTVETGHRFLLGLTNTGQPFFLDNTQSLREVDESIRACKILELGRVREDGIECILNDCLAGPQTPEKAKQASFVALDVRKGLFGQFDKRADEKDCVSVLVLTEFSHWEPKSVNMIKASIDYNLVVDDALVVSAMSAYEDKYGDHFLDQITKEQFMASDDARAVALGLVEARSGKIFRDIADSQMKSISLSASGRLRIT